MTVEVYVVDDGGSEYESTAYRSSCNGKSRRWKKEVEKGGKEKEVAVKEDEEEDEDEEEVEEEVEGEENEEEEQHK
ncbi:hypothetical protein HZH66_009627 [Vespula vulgaris]|uniref:Uncharacterized protein n=1 Tax=Vespula vulgaris TaxID=7454 RepID=A0A834JN16_VESVU|nr:hypothetical protein HZH66_009627 [Vespula vulgaris]